MEKRLKMVLAGLVLSAGMAMAQTQISGTVISAEDGQPVIGASVKVVGTKMGTVTDIDGNFSLNAPAGSKLEISYIGMTSQTVSAKSGKMNINLQADRQNLDEVVVVAYGTAKRQSITGAVTSIDAKNIEKRIGTSVTGALEGSAPGIQVNSTYGEPGAAPKISIRGIGTLTKYDAEGNDASAPLFVVDGVAYNGNIADINPNDIASMSVLKDAASAALYGNRAANGVIIITTKNGRSASKPTFSVKINQGIYTRGIKEYERLGADQWMEASWQALKHYAMTNSALAMNETDAAAYATKNLISTNAKRNIYDAADDALFDANGKLIANRLPYYDDLDWNDAIERNGHRQDYNVTAQMGSDKFNVFSSFGYLNEKGYIVGSGYERFTGRVNSMFKPNKYFEMGINVNATFSQQSYNSNAEGTYNANPFHSARFMAPIYPYYKHNSNGEYVFDANGNKQYDTSSPYLGNYSIAYVLRHNTDDKDNNQLGGQAYLTVNLPYDFSVTVKGDVNRLVTAEEKYDNPLIGDGATNNGRFTQSTLRRYTTTGQQLLNWNHDFDIHHIDALFGHESYKYKRQLTRTMNTNMAVDGIYAMSNFLTNSSAEGYTMEDREESYFLRGRYNYDQKYFLDASIRWDGSSRFADGKRWGSFFSLGGSWDIKREAFMKPYNWVNDLRLRASYGEVGNNKALDFYAYQALYYIDKNAGDPALMKQSLDAGDIKWETTKTIDVALEGKLFDRLNFSLGYFNKRSQDLLMAVKMPLSAGSFSYGDTRNMTVFRNIGSITNSGFEFTADVAVVKSHGFKWNVGLDATFLSNKINELVNHEDYVRSSVRLYSEGHSLYDWYTYHFEGVDQMTGRSLYTIDPDKKSAAASKGMLVTINGVDYTYDASTYGKKDFRGTAKPTVFGSFHTDLTWKNFTLNMLLTYSLGGKIFDETYRQLMSTATATSASALHVDVLKSWNGVPAGMTETSADRILVDGTPLLDYTNSNYNNAVSDRFLVSASYLVFKNINLTYRVPVKYLQKIGINGMTVNAGVENLLTITARQGMNPQYSFDGMSEDTYVTPRVWNFGVQFNF
ncbi:MAG: SusC/RagA family TonB-linked outer membrane protein [Prevotella sp.]|nr:SusC/RagA family TonB-linked outer membrane protein [Prevotella sp.]